jgi:putative transposase
LTVPGRSSGLPAVRQRLGDVLRTLAKQKECQAVEGHLLPDHADLDPAEVLGLSGYWVHQGEERDSRGADVLRPQAELCRAALLGAGVLVSTVGRDEATIREYIRNQEVEDKRQDQLKLQ